MGDEDNKNLAESGRRAYPRLRLRISAHLIALHDQGSAIVENISATGARISTRLELHKGMSCIVQLPGLEVLADVAWSNRERCGLLFEEPLTQPQLLALRQLADGPPPDERVAQRAWARNFVNGTSARLD
ncbi:MAG: PilZ domain-containing protein [Novosphingobium sp.]